jgi:hypothetical protein
MIAEKISRAVALFLILSAAAPTGGIAASTAQTGATAARTYASANEAVTALVDTLRADKRDELRIVLGPGSNKLLSSGDKYSDAEERQKFLAAYDEQNELVSAAPNRMVLQVGKINGHCPYP